MKIKNKKRICINQNLTKILLSTDKQVKQRKHNYETVLLMKF